MIFYPLKKNKTLKQAFHGVWTGVLLTFRPMFPCFSDFNIVCGLRRALLISPMFSDYRIQPRAYSFWKLSASSLCQVLCQICWDKRCLLSSSNDSSSCMLGCTEHRILWGTSEREGWANEPVNERTYSNSLLSFGTLIHLFSIPCPVACRRIGNGKSSIFVWSLWSLVCSVERVRNSLSVHSPHPQLSGRRNEMLLSAGSTVGTCPPRGSPCLSTPCLCSQSTFHCPPGI